MKVKLSEVSLGYNPRTVFENIDELANSIMSMGLLNPLTVASGNGKGGYILLDGRRRLEALKKLKINEAEVHLVTLDEWQQKEVPIATDFFKDKLRISEKAIGVANLINKEKKVTPETLAKRYNFKLSDVHSLLKLATLQKGVLGSLDNGLITVKQALEITKIKREDVQLKVAEFMANKEHCGLIDALENVAFELPFDDVFTFEQAKKDNQIGIIVKDDDENERVFTYDKAYFDQKNAEYRTRSEKSYEETVAKTKAAVAAAKPKELSKEEKKAKREKVKASFDKTLEAFHDATVSFFKQKPNQKDISTLIDRFTHQIGADNCRVILKSFKVPFKASDLNSEDYKRMVAKVFADIVKNEAQLAKLILYVDHLGKIYKTTMFELDGVKQMIAKINK